MKNKVALSIFLIVLLVSFNVLAEETTSEVTSETQRTEEIANPAEAASEGQEQNAQGPSEPPPEQTMMLTGAQPFQSTEKFQVEPSTGTASLNIPIDVPQGRKGIQPSLSLMYNSSFPNGILGGGWNLELGSIQRSTKRGVPTYNDSQDTFVLAQQGSSQELVSIGGGLYRAKIEGAFMKIEYNGSSGWLVTDKKGIKYYFGQNSASQQNDGSRVFKWCLDRVEDLNANYMTIAYFKDQYQIYPQHIYYTGNFQTGASTFADIEFVYENRTDTNLSFRTGFAVTTAQRLSQILVRVDSNLQRRYELSYDSSSQCSLIESITQYGQDGAALPPTTFEYTEKSSTFDAISYWDNLTWYGSVSWASIRHVPAGGQTQVDLFDLNGDGLPDRIMRGDQVGDLGNWYVQMNNGTSFDNPVTWGPISYSTAGWSSIRYTDASGQYMVELVDINGDGRADRVIRGDGLGGDYGHWDIQLNNGNGFDAVTQWGPVRYSPSDAGTSSIRHIYPVPNHQVGDLIDINGDGLPDRVLRGDILSGDFNRWDVQLNNGTGFNEPISWGPVRYPNGGDPHFTSIRITYPVPGHRVVDLIDINGDGLPDRVLRGDIFGGWEHWYVQLNNGTGFEELSQWGPIYYNDIGGTGWTSIGATVPSNGETFLDLMDIDGDGLPDRVGRGDVFGDHWDHWYAQLNNGSGFADLAQWSTIYHAAGTGWASIRGYSGSDCYVDVADINGDGLVDRVMRGDVNGGYERWVVQLGAGLVPYKLSSINNHIGGITQISYTPSTRFDNTGSDNISDLPFPVQVVTSVTATDQVIGQSYTTNYTYKNGKFDFLNREFRGFGYVKVTDADGNYSETEFLQGDYDKGRIKEQRSYAAGNPNPYTKVVNTWASQDLGNGSNFVYLSQVDNFVFNGDATGKRTQAQYFYEESPQRGNPTRSIDLAEVALDSGSDLDPTDNRTSFVEYAYNPALWLLGLPKHTFLKDSQDTIKSQKWFYYDGHQGLDDQPTLGFLTKEEGWLQGGTNPFSQFTYDEYGNLLTTTDALNHQATVTYDSTYHLFPLTTTNALGHQVINEYYGVNGVSLDDGNYRGLWGQTKSSQDPNANKSYSIYDTFGRALKTISPYDSIEYPTSSIEYHLNSIPIKIISHQREVSGQAGTLDSVSFYDGLGRLIQTKTESKEEGRFIVSGQTEFNSRGLPWKKYLPFFDTNYGFSEPVPLTQNPYLPSTLTYDALARAIQSTNPDGTHSNVIYDDWVTTTIDENGHKQMSYSDGFGRLFKKEEYSGADGRSPHYPSAAYALYATTYYSYDTLGNLIQTRDNSNNITVITYDTLARKISMTDPDMGTWRYEYDAVGNLFKQTDAKNQEITFEYDPINRLLVKHFTLHPENDVSYTYDDPAVQNSKGRLTKANYSQSSGNTKFFYDALGREIKSEKKIDTTTYAVERTYDAASRLTSVTYPDATPVNYAYNNAGQIEQVRSISNADFSTKLLLHSNGQDGSTNFLDSSLLGHPITAFGDSQIDTQEFKFGGASGLFPGQSGNDSYAKLLLHADGPDGSTAFTDSSASNHPLTAYGNSQIDTAQSKFGGASGLFDGTGDYLSAPDSADWNFGTGDFTIDCWVRFNSLPANNGDTQAIYAQWYSGEPDYSYISFYLINVAGNLQWQMYGVNGGVGYFGGMRAGADNTLAINTWYHIAYVSHSGTTLVYRDGVVVGGSIETNPYPNIAAPLTIGRIDQPSSYFDGWIDELRISKGIARWTENFTPPSSSYLTPGHLSLPDSNDWNFGSGDWTIDCWARFNSLPYGIGLNQFMVFYSQASDSPWSYIDFSVRDNGYGQIELQFESINESASVQIIRPIAITTSQWYHFAVTRSGNTFRLFQDGVRLGADYTNSNSIPDLPSPVLIGAFQHGSPHYFMDGWLDELRVSKGIARWTSNFTPPTAEYSTGVQNYVSNVDYSASGQITHIEYGNGVVTDYSYDPNTLRLTQLVTEHQGSRIQDLTYSYDSAGNILQITDAVNSGTQTFTYDEISRLISANGVYGAKTYEYNQIGNILSKDGLTFNYAAGGAGPHAVTSLSDGTTFAYDTNGNMSSTTNSELITMNYEYDFENRLKVVRKNNRLLAQFTYDGDGGRTKKVIYPGCGGGAFLNQPLENRRYVLEFRSSFLTQMNTDEKQQINTDNNLRLAQILSQNIGPLSNGFTELASFVKDIFTVKEAEARSLYDIGPGGGGGGGGPAPTITLYVGSLFEKQFTGLRLDSTTKHIFLGSQRVASIEQRGTSIETKYFHTNHLGSTDTITDATGAQVVHYEYTPYGQIASTDGTDSTAYKFTGKPLDDATGLYYYGARYYNPTIGRFITPDSIVQSPFDPQSLNRYSYCGNNPIIRIDPNGNLWWFIPMIVGAIKGAFIGAAIGAGFAAIMGGNIGQGALLGAIGGAFFGGTTGIIGQLAKEGIKLSTSLTILAYTEAGAYSGALGALAIGSDPGRGAGFGALSGAVFGSIGGLGGKNWKWDVARVGLSGVAGGGISELAGGSFLDGFIFAGSIAGADFVYRAILSSQGRTQGASMKPAGKSGQPKLDANGNPINGSSETVLQDDLTVNHVGSASKSIYNGKGFVGQIEKIGNNLTGETGPVMNLVGRNVPGFQGLSLAHDIMGSFLKNLVGNAAYGVFLNVPTMAPIYGLNFAGSAINDNPALIGLYEALRDE